MSVRSGSVFSMPGMMDTVLNLGMNDETVKGVAELTEIHALPMILTVALFKCLAMSY